MSDELDPEVRADIRLRERLARERPGMTDGQFAQQVRTIATPPKILDREPCRARCGAVCEWNEAAEEQFNMFNRELARRDEPPLDRTQVMACPACMAKLTEARSVKLRERATEMAGWIRELKAGCTEARERELLLKLEKRHPDLDGLKQWLRERTGKKRTARGGM